MNDDDLTAEELQDLKQRVAALTDDELAEQVDSLAKLLDLRLTQGGLSESFMDYHEFWTELLNAELMNREKDE